MGHIERFWVENGLVQLLPVITASLGVTWDHDLHAETDADGWKIAIRPKQKL